MVLKSVPKSKPTEKQAVLERIKKLPKAAMQCNRCGCRTSITAKNGGTVIFKDLCSQCWKQGIDSPMQPTIKQV